MKNYYKILEVNPKADYKDIRDAFWRLSKMYHPDLHQQDKDFEDFFKEIQEAYEVLKNPVRRMEYDQQLRLFELQRTPAGRTASFIRSRILRTKKSREPRENTPPYAAVKPAKNISRIILLLLFISLAVTLVFFAEKQFSENPLNNAQLSYKIDRPEPEPLIVPEWEIPELPAAKTLTLKSPEENKKEETISEPEKQEKAIEEDAVKVKAVIKPTFHQLEKQIPKAKEAAAEKSVSEPAPDLIINPAPVSEEKTAEADKIYTEADKQPSFGGGVSAFVEYLKTNLQYPPDARDKGITGRVLLTFVVEKSGKVSNVSVVQGIGSGCDEEAVRVMKNAPNWIPGEEKGEKVRVQCTIPITFALQ